MAITVVQTASGTALPLSFPNPVTAGNTVIVVDNVLFSGAPILASPTLGGNPVAGSYPIWNQSGSNAIDNPAGIASSVWVLPNCPAANGINFGTNNVSFNAGVAAYEVAGLGSSPTVNVSSAGEGSSNGSTPESSGTAGPITAAPAFVIGAFATTAGSGGWTFPGFTIISPRSSSWAGYLIDTSAGNSYAWAQTEGSGTVWTAGVAAIVAPAPAGTPVAAAFTGTGALTATVAARYPATAALAGTGALAATVTAVPQIPVTAAFTGAGVLHATIREPDQLDAYPDAVYTINPENTTATPKPETTTATIGPDNTGAAP